MKKILGIVLLTLAFAPQSFASSVADCEENASNYIAESTGETVTYARELGRPDEGGPEVEVYVRTNQCSYSVFYSHPLCNSVSRVLSWCDNQ